MANFYSFDPNNVSPLASQSGMGGAVPENPLSPSPPSVDAASASATPASSSLPSTSESGSSRQKRLVPGTELSSSRYKIERVVASGGMGAVYRAIDTRFNRP